MFDLAETYAEFIESPQSFFTSESNVDLVYQITDSPELILEEDTWPQVLSNACPEPLEFTNQSSEWVSFICSQLEKWEQLYRTETFPIGMCREAIEKYMFLAKIHFSRLEIEIEPRESNSRSINAFSAQQTRDLLRAIANCLSSVMIHIFPAEANAKRASMALLYVEPSCRFLQNTLAVKDVGLVKAIIHVLCLAVVNQGQEKILKDQIIQLLGYYDHTVKVIVSLLNELSQKYDNARIAEEVLLDVAEEAATWTDTQTTTTTTKAKTIGEFLLELGSSSPQIVAENVVAFSELLSSPVPQLRQSILELIPQVIHQLVSGANENIIPANGDGGNGNENGTDEELNMPADHESARLKPAFDLVKLVETRVNDSSYFCRTKAVRALSQLCLEPALLKRHEAFVEIAVLKMRDRTLKVRQEGTNLMIQIMKTHPPLIHASNFDRTLWETSLREVSEQLDMNMDMQSDAYQQLEAAEAFIKFTLSILDHIDKGMSIAQSLLSSSNKSDNLCSINLLVHADAYSVKSSELGIRSIVHLVWAQAENDEHNDVCKTAVSTYVDLFLTAPPSYPQRQAANYIAENIIKLAQKANMGEQISLAEMLRLAMNGNAIPPTAIARLWQFYQSSEVEISKRRGAALALSMISAADETVGKSGVGVVNLVCLNRTEIPDIMFLKHSCAILKNSVPPNSPQRLPPNFDLFAKINDMLLKPYKEDIQWTNFAKEALGAIFSMCDMPTKVYDSLLKEYMALVFGSKSLDIEPLVRQQLFVQMLYIAGEVSLNILLFLERCETDFKRKAQEKKDRMVQGLDSANSTAEEIQGGSAEEDFADMIKCLKNDGILYSDKSLLKPFAGAVVDVCTQELNHSITFNTQKADQQIAQEDETHESLTPPPNPSLGVIAATHTLAKFMCISEKFCDAQTPLLMDLLSQHPSNVVRGNFVIALSDLSILHNSIIDRYTEHLYNRLQDEDSDVQRTTVVALTFLILAGQIKVKGKLGEMAKAIASPDRKISVLATMFFRELGTKENAIYNGFMDMLSTLIADETLLESDMLKIFKFLAPLITKAQNIKSLTTNLVTKKLPRASSEREWNAYAIVLRSLNGKLDDEVKELLAKKYQGVREASDESEVSMQLEDDSFSADPQTDAPEVPETGEAPEAGGTGGAPENPEAPDADVSMDDSSHPQNATPAANATSSPPSSPPQRPSSQPESGADLSNAVGDMSIHN